MKYMLLLIAGLMMFSSNVFAHVTINPGGETYTVDSYGNIDLNKKKEIRYPSSDVKIRNSVIIKNRKKR